MGLRARIIRRSKLTTETPTLPIANNGATHNNVAPLSQDWRLANGQMATFEMPNMLKFANGSFDIPNDLQAEIYELIYGNGTMSIHPMEQLNFSRHKLRGLYALFAIVCVNPIFVLDDDLREAGQIGPRNVGWIDVSAAYNFFRLGPPTYSTITTGEKS